MAAWYVGRASWRRRWRGLLLLGLVAGIVGGAVLGALAGARRTSSAYDRLVEASQAPHIVMFVTDERAAVLDWVAQLDVVDHYERAAGMIGRRAPEQDWWAVDAPYEGVALGTPVLARGRLPNPDRADEVLITYRTAQNTGLDLGDEFEVHAYASEQGAVITDDPWTIPTGPQIRAHVVGIARDPTDASLSQTTKIVFGTPALAHEYGEQAASDLLALWFDNWPEDGAAFEREVTEFASTFGGNVPFSAVSSVSDKESADHAANAVVTGLLIFALVAGLAGAITVGQAVRRYLARDDDAQAVMLELGSSRGSRAVSQLIGALPFLAMAPVVAVAVAYLVSPVFPLGAARALEPAPGLHNDLLVYIAGGVAWLALLAGITVAVVWLRNDRATRGVRERESAAAPSSRAGGNALPAAIGIAFALWPGNRRRSLQRTSLIGVIVALAGVVGSVLFVASLDDFTSSADRYGLPYDVTLELPNSESQSVMNRIAAVPDLEAVATARAGTVELEGRTLDAYSVEPLKGALSPVSEDGRVPTGASEIALGPKLLADLDKDIGDTVQLSANGDTHELTIVGTAYSPLPESTGFNSRVILAPTGFEQYATNAWVQALGRARPGVDREALIEDLDALFPYAVSDESLPHAPGPVRNIEQVARLPLVLALFFMFLGAAAVTHAAYMTAVERRRDIAILRSLGFTRRQGTTVVGAAATAIALVAVVIGVPLGILAGRIGWNTVARGLFVDPGMIVPVLAVVGVVAGLLLFAYLVALFSAHRALRAGPGAMLRAE